MNKVIELINVPAVLMIILFCNSCKKKDCHKTGECPPEYYRIRFGEVKDYLFAKPGSYWIYENSVTGELDTQRCVEFHYDSITVSGTQNYSQHITLKYDRIFRTISSSYNQVDYYERTNSNTPDDKNFYNNSVILERGTDASLSPNYIFLYPFQPNIAYGNGVSLTKFIKTDSTLVLKGKTFESIAQMDVDIDVLKEKGCPNYSPSSYYWAKNVGLVKKVLIGCNYSWNLIEYKIIR